MKSGLIVMKHLINMTMCDLKKKKDSGNLSVGECLQELGYLKLECEKLIKEYEK